MRLPEEDYYRKAQKIVKAKKAFRVNAWLFAITMPVIIAVNLMTSPHYLWFLWSLLGWGTTLGILYLVAYVFPKYTSNEENEIEEEMEKMRLRSLKTTKKDDFDEHLDLRELRKDYEDRDFV